MAGRPPRFTDDMRQKMEDAASMGCSDTEIALYCDISRQTLYNWKNNHPDLVDRIEELRERPILLARQTIIDNLSNPQYALEYLKRKRRSEFGDKSEVDLTTGGEKLNFDDKQINTIAERIAERSRSNGNSPSEEASD